MPRLSHKGFAITYDNGIVSLEKQLDITDNFDMQLNVAKSILFAFRSSGITWGCDGVGYEIAKRKRFIRIHRSKVTQQFYDDGLRRLGFKVNKFVK